MDLASGFGLFTNAISVAKKINNIIQQSYTFDERSQRAQERINRCISVFESLSKVDVSDSLRNQAEDTHKCLTEILDYITPSKSTVKKIWDEGFKNKLEKLMDRLDRSFDDLSVHISAENLIGQGEMKELLKKCHEAVALSRTNENVVEISETHIRVHGDAVQSWCYGKIYKGEWKMQNVTLKSISNNADRNILLEDAKKQLRLNSENVVRLFGVSKLSEIKGWVIVMEYMERGDLRLALAHEDAQTLSWKQRIQMALGGALGMHFIHDMDRPMLHRGLASNKFMVNGGWIVKISDVGIVKTITSIKRQPELEEQQALVYISPERLDEINHEIDKPSEVYSYGIIMWEIATGKKPYEDFANNNEVFDFVLSKQKLELPYACPECFQSLIDNCRDYHPTARPNSEDIVKTLQDLAR